MTARPCTVCGGTGEEIPHPCTVCRGDGRVPKRETIQVQIPAGVEDGMELRVGGHGQDGRVGGAAGDLYAAVRVRPHPIFERRGQDRIALHENEVPRGCVVRVVRRFEHDLGVAARQIDRHDICVLE